MYYSLLCWLYRSSSSGTRPSQKKVANSLPNQRGSKGKKIASTEQHEESSDDSEQDCCDDSAPNAPHTPMIDPPIPSSPLPPAAPTSPPSQAPIRLIVSRQYAESLRNSQVSNNEQTELEKFMDGFKPTRAGLQITAGATAAPPAAATAVAIGAVAAITAPSAFTTGTTTTSLSTPSSPEPRRNSHLQQCSPVRNGQKTPITMVSVLFDHHEALIQGEWDEITVPYFLYLVGQQYSLRDFYRNLTIKPKYWFEKDVAAVLGIDVSQVRHLDLFKGIENLIFPIVGFSIATALSGTGTSERDFFMLPEIITKHLEESTDTSFHRPWNLKEVTKHFVASDVMDPEGIFVKLSQKMPAHY